MSSAPQSAAPSPLHLRWLCVTPWLHVIVGSHAPSIQCPPALARGWAGRVVDSWARWTWGWLCPWAPPGWFLTTFQVITSIDGFVLTLTLTHRWQVDTLSRRFLDKVNLEKGVPMGATKLGFSSVQYSVLEAQGVARCVRMRAPRVLPACVRMRAPCVLPACDSSSLLLLGALQSAGGAGRALPSGCVQMYTRAVSCRCCRRCFCCQLPLLGVGGCKGGEYPCAAVCAPWSAEWGPHAPSPPASAAAWQDPRQILHTCCLWIRRVVVVRYDGDLSAPLTLSYATKDGTAVAGIDYTAAEVSGGS